MKPISSLDFIIDSLIGRTRHINYLIICVVNRTGTKCKTGKVSGVAAMIIKTAGNAM